MKGHVGAERRTIVELFGLRVTSPADTWADLGMLPGALDLDQLVILGDAVVRLLDGELPRQAEHSIGLGDLAQVVKSRSAHRGVRRLEEALALVRARVRSPMETLSRLLVVRAGFPEPAVNADLFDQDGEWLMECDLVWYKQRVGAEYQGAHHADIRARSEDAARRHIAAEAGWRVVEMFAADYYSRPRRVRFLTRLAELLELDPRQLNIE